MDGDALCEAFGLDEPLAQPVLATTGWGGHNRLWRLRTATGTYAVKEECRGQPASPEALAIELAAVAAGIPAPEPVLASGGGAYVKVGDATVRCHRWAPGVAKTNEEATPADAQRMGIVLARLHALALPASAPAPHQPVGRDVWNSLAGRAPTAPWAQLVLEHIDRIEEAERAATLELDEVIGSHRDVNAHNVLFGDHGDLCLIDWDAAGPASPAFERANYPLLWAQTPLGDYDVDVAAAFLQGYRDAGGGIDPADGELLGLWLVGLTNWTLHNLRLAIAGIGDNQDHLAALLVQALVSGPATIAKRRHVLTAAHERLR